MASSSGRWKQGLIAAVLAAAVLLWVPLNHLVFSVRLALSVQKFASGATGQNLAVRETKVRRPMGARICEALIYRPARSPATSAVIIAAGISELGCYHPRLVALSRFLADQGLLVITPDIQELRDFQVSAEPIDQILFWYSQVATIEGGEKIPKTGLAGISYSGTLALMAAARPEIRDSVGFVVGIGSYCNLIRCTRDWLAAGSAAAGDSYSTRCYGKWIVMRSALDMIASVRDRRFLHGVLDNLLLQKKIPPPGSDLTPEGLRWYELAIMREDRPDPELAEKIEEYLVAGIYAQLDPKDDLGSVRCPVFLIHGAYDDLISPGESMELHRRIANSHLLLTPFLTHTHPTDVPLSLKAKAKAAADTLVFCYQFSRVLD
jgi:pimeloyl-ACP methyl ester carboxylesterase